MNRLHSRHTGIDEILDVGNGFIILERFENYPEGESNLYKVSYSFAAIWDAEVPRINTTYLDGLTIERPGVIKAFTWEDCMCHIDINTGKILTKHWSK